MILLTGASGMVGGPAVRTLLRGGHHLRVLSSSESSADKLRAAGVGEVVVGNLRNDADVASALQGVDTIVHIPPAVVEDEHEIGYRMVAAAEQAGTDHFVFISCYHPHPADIRSHHNKLLVEDALYKSNLNFTVLQPSMFMQNIGLMWSVITESGVLAWPWSKTQKFAMFDTEDLAKAIAAVVAEPRFQGGTYELSSDDRLSVTEMAGLLGEAMGRPIEAAELDLDEWLAQMRNNGAPVWTVENVRGMAQFYNEYGYKGGNSVVYQAITGRQAATYREFANRFVGEMTS